MKKVALCIMGIPAAIIVAIVILFCGFLGVLGVNSWLYRHFLGEGIADLLVEAIVVLFWATVLSIVFDLLVTLPLFLVFKRLRNIENMWRVWKILFAVAVLVIGIPHYWMSRELFPLKMEFRAAAASHNAGLDEIVRRRNQCLAEHQFISKGGWWSDKDEPSLAMVYIYTGWFNHVQVPPKHKNITLCEATMSPRFIYGRESGRLGKAGCSSAEFVFVRGRRTSCFAEPGYLL